jgi:hypothetical protein
MKKALYGSTALAAAGLLAGAAQAADKIKLGVGGYFQAFGVYSDQDDGVGEPAANLRDHHIAREGEIYFRGSTALDNGIEVGVLVQLEASTCADQIDQSYIWFEGASASSAWAIITALRTRCSMARRRRSWGTA